MTNHTPMLLGDIVAFNARHRTRSVALIIDDQPITYGELEAEVDAAARALLARGISKGDRVAALGRNSLQYIQLYFATARIGAMLVPLSFWQRAPEIQYVMGDADPQVLFFEPEMSELVSLAREDRGDALPAVELPARDGGSAAWDAFIEGGRSIADATLQVDLVPDDPHMILYTSGTTGKPKGAMLSHARTVNDAFAMALALRLRETDTFIDYFPSFHVGNWDHLKLYLLVGAKTVMLREFDAAGVIAAIERYHATVLLGVPTMFHDILEHPSFADADTSSVRLVYYGAYDPSGIMARTAEAFGAAGGQTEMAHTYGLTEGGPFVTFCPPEDVFSHWGSIGRAMPGVQIALLDEDLNEVSVGEAGEICIRGPRMSGYWRKPQETEAAFAGGWVHTGDMAISDEDGFLWIVDRKKDMIRSGGQNVYSKQVEDCLSEHPAVEDCAVIGLPDPVYEELVCAVIVPKLSAVPGEELEEQIKSYVRASLAGYNTPKQVRFVDEIPKNAVGKTQKHVLRAKLGSVFATSTPAT